ncbi:membrane hypothetical protein [Enhydrobacter sp. AX1]|nr:hypothetical protein [Enhydrobacter sp. AX1]VXA91444.1 membrane hypothetical protein [Enhydrobacter sp. AX1]
MQIIIGLFIILVVIGVVWQLIAGNIEIILGFVFVFALGWVLQWLLGLASINLSLWLTVPIVVVALLIFGALTPTPRTAYDVLDDYFKSNQMADIKELKSALSNEDFNVNHQEFMTTIRKLINENKITEALPNELWKSTRTGGFVNQMQTSEISLD